MTGWQQLAIGLATILVGGGGIGGIMLWRWQARKLEAEAASVEASAEVTRATVFQTPFAQARELLEVMRSDNQQLRLDLAELRERVRSAQKAEETCQEQLSRLRERVAVLEDVRKRPMRRREAGE